MSPEYRFACRLLVTLFLLSGSALAQTPADSDRARKTALNMLHSREVPPASLPCSPAEAKWWADLRKAAKAVQDSRGSKRERKKYLALLQAGQEKSYQPPIADRPALVLSRTQPAYSEAARRRQIKGSVALVVELRPDGFVGNVEVVQGLEASLDENAMEAARHTVFLPRVKDRKFVPFVMPVTMSFNIY